MTAHRERSISRKRSGSDPAAASPDPRRWRRPRIIAAGSAGGREEGSCGPCRVRDRFRVRPGSGRRPRRPASAIVPLSVTFGDESFRAGVDLSTAEFWERMTAPGRAVPEDRGRRARASSRRSTSGVFAEGADAIVSVHVSPHAVRGDEERRGREGPAPRPEIHLVDSQGASMAEGDPLLPGPRDGEAGRVGRGDRPRPQRPGDRPPDVRLARDARVPEEGRPDQRRPGGDRDAALGQADHRGRGTAWSRPPTSRGRGRSRASAASS